MASTVIAPRQPRLLHGQIGVSFPAYANRDPINPARDCGMVLLISKALNKR
jgi:hypothetical protein